MVVGRLVVGVLLIVPADTKNVKISSCDYIRKMFMRYVQVCFVLSNYFTI